MVGTNHLMMLNMMKSKNIHVGFEMDENQCQEKMSASTTTEKGLRPIKAVLLGLEPSIRRLALDNLQAHPTGIANTRVYKLSDAVKVGFYWRDTPQGKEYWKKIYTSLETLGL